MGGNCYFREVPKSLTPPIALLVVAGRRVVTGIVSRAGMGRQTCSVRFWAESSLWEVCH